MHVVSRHNPHVPTLGLLAFAAYNWSRTGSVLRLPSPRLSVGARASCTWIRVFIADRASFPAPTKTRSKPHGNCWWKANERWRDFKQIPFSIVDLVCPLVWRVVKRKTSCHKRFWTFVIVVSEWRARGNVLLHVCPRCTVTKPSCFVIRCRCLPLRPHPPPPKLPRLENVSDAVSTVASNGIYRWRHVMWCYALFASVSCWAGGIDECLKYNGQIYRLTCRIYTSIGIKYACRWMFSLAICRLWFVIWRAWALFADGRQILCECRASEVCFLKTRFWSVPVMNYAVWSCNTNFMRFIKTEMAGTERQTYYGCVSALIHI